MILEKHRPVNVDIQINSLMEILFSGWKLSLKRRCSALCLYLSLSISLPLSLCVSVCMSVCLPLALYLVMPWGPKSGASFICFRENTNWSDVRNVHNNSKSNNKKSVLIILFFFLVLCLPRQVPTSNDAIRHDDHLSPSTCCNPFPSSSPITSFSAFPLSFPFHSSLNYNSKKEILFLSNYVAQLVSPSDYCYNWSTFFYHLQYLFICPPSSCFSPSVAISTSLGYLPSLKVCFRFV